jgi:type III restriction enzyme
MSNPFFDHPILNSPYRCPARHWELDPDGQPTQKVLERRRAAEFIASVPKSKKRKKAGTQMALAFDEGLAPSTAAPQPFARKRCPSAAPAAPGLVLTS